MISKVICGGSTRQRAISDALRRATAAAEAAGAVRGSCRVAAQDVVPLAYMPGGAARVKVRVVGELDLERAVQLGMVDSSTTPGGTRVAAVPGIGDATGADVTRIGVTSDADAAGGGGDAAGGGVTRVEPEAGGFQEIEGVSRQQQHQGQADQYSSSSSSSAAAAKLEAAAGQTLQVAAAATTATASSSGIGGTRPPLFDSSSGGGGAAGDGSWGGSVGGESGGGGGGGGSGDLIASPSLAFQNESEAMCLPSWSAQQLADHKPFINEQVGAGGVGGGWGGGRLHPGGQGWGGMQGFEGGIAWTGGECTAASRMACIYYR